MTGADRATPDPVPDAQSLGAVGALLLDAGESVTEVHAGLRRAARPGADLRFAVLPQLVIVTKASTGESIVVASSGTELTSAQAAQASILARGLEDGTIPVSRAREEISRVRAMPHPHPLTGSVGGALVAVGLAVVFRCPWWAVLASLVVGWLVGLLVRAVGRLEGAAAVVPFVAALASTAVVGELATLLHLGPVPLYAVCAPIAILVPGALITNALLELTASDMVTGAGRLAYGVILLGLMVVGIMAGSALTGLSLDGASASLVGDIRSISTQADGWQALPPVWFSWLGVVVLAIGVGLALGSGVRLTLLGIATMLFTYAVVVLLTPALGGPAATGVAGAALFVGARFIERRWQLAPASATFQPAFLLLVPGTVGLVALASTDSRSIGTAVITFVSLCLGTKTGAVISDNVRRVRARHLR